MKIADFASEKPLLNVIHFNRIAMQRGESEVWTVHNSRGCFNVKKVTIQDVLAETVYKPNGAQPRAKFRCRAYLTIIDGEAILHP